MIQKYCGGVVPAAATRDDIDEELIELATTTASRVEEKMNEFQFNLALEEIWTLIRRANKYIDEKTPWILAKDETKKAELDTVMRNLAESLRIVSILIIPYMHTTSDRMREQLGLADVEGVWEDAFEFYNDFKA
jgi:methionyl-tRNA synthetase